MDKIKLNGLRFYGHHGFHAEETRLGQSFVVSLIMEVDLAKAGQTDDLEQTIDYSDVMETVAKIVEGPPMRLIERVAEEIARQVLKRHPRLQAITVECLKPNPPIPQTFDGVAVEITRSNPA